MRLTFSAVGETKYTAGTSPMGCRSFSKSRCRVTPCRRSSCTLTSGVMISKQCLSMIRTLYTSFGAFSSSAPAPSLPVFRLSMCTTASCCLCRMENAMATEPHEGGSLDEGEAGLERAPAVRGLLWWNARRSRGNQGRGRREREKGSSGWRNPTPTAVNGRTSKQSSDRSSFVISRKIRFA